MTPAILVWLFLRHRGLYGRARTALVLTSAIGLVGFLLYPTAPPRFVAGYVDTLAAYDHIGWWSAHASAPRGFGQFTNELAAMPSLHCGWALWVAWAVVSSGARRRWRYLAIGYAAGTAVVVVVTGNHWTLDVLVGWAVAVAGIALSTTPFGRRVDQRLADTIVGRGANRAGVLVLRGFQELGASWRWTVVTPVVASTCSSFSAENDTRTDPSITAGASFIASSTWLRCPFEHAEPAETKMPSDCRQLMIPCDRTPGSGSPRRAGLGPRRSGPGAD